MEMRYVRGLVAGVVGLALASLAITMSMLPALSETGWSPWFGFLFSEHPLLRLVGVLQLAAGAAMAVLAVTLLRRWRK